MQISIRMLEQICNNSIMVNAIFRPLFGEGARNWPVRTGNFSGSEPLARVPHVVRGDVSAERRTPSGLGTSTPMPPRFPASPSKINNKIKMFARADKNFLTISPEHLALDECCEPGR
jgi:hypothetical protein